MIYNDLLAILKRIEKEQPPYGSIKLELVFHDGQLRYYCFDKNERFNLITDNNDKK